MNKIKYRQVIPHMCPYLSDQFLYWSFRHYSVFYRNLADVRSFRSFSLGKAISISNSLFQSLVGI